MKAILPALSLAGLLVAPLVQAQTTFRFADTSTTIGAGLDGLSSGSFTVGTIGITATASAAVFNATSSEFGINQTASGDDTDGFDFGEVAGPGIAEGFTLSFDQGVQLIGFSVSSWNDGTDAVTITEAAATVATIANTGMTSLGNYSLSLGSTLTVATTGGSYGNGWSFDEITVVVPEPGAGALFAGLGGMAFVALRRRRA